MQFPNFNEWLVIREGKKGKHINRKDYNDFISGKSDIMTLTSGPIALGHQPHQSGTGAWENKKAYNRKGKNWKKDQE